MKIIRAILRMLANHCPEPNIKHFFFRKSEIVIAKDTCVNVNFIFYYSPLYHCSNYVSKEKYLMKNLNIVLVSRNVTIFKKFATLMAEKIPLKHIFFIDEPKRCILEKENYFLERKSVKKTAELFNQLKSNQNYDKFFKRVKTPSKNKATYLHRLNDVILSNRIKQYNPDIIIYHGTQIVKTPLLYASKIASVNIHYSMLPYYKGRMSEFWQQLNSDPNSFGVTVHRIDTGVDTGNIVIQKRLKVKPTDAFYDLRYQNMINVLDILPKACYLLKKGYKGKKQKELSNDQIYRHKDMTILRKQEYLCKVLPYRGVDCDELFCSDLFYENKATADLLTYIHQFTKQLSSKIGD